MENYGVLGGVVAQTFLRGRRERALLFARGRCSEDRKEARKERKNLNRLHGKHKSKFFTAEKPDKPRGDRALLYSQHGRLPPSCMAVIGQAVQRMEVIRGG